MSHHKLKLHPGDPAADSTLTPLDAASAQPAPGQTDAAPQATETLIGLELDAGPRKSRISHNTILLMGVIAVAAVVLLGMRKVGLGPASAQAMADFDAKLLEAQNQPRRDHRPVLADLNASRTTLQVPDTDVRANPFLITVAEVTPDPALAERRAADALRAEAERLKQLQGKREQELRSAIANLRLNSVLGGGRGRARINGQLVGVGDRVGDFFILKTIHGRSVELEAEGRLFHLEMDQRALPADEQNLDPTQENPAPAQPWSPPPMAPRGW
jgi:hypothetical protein